MPLKTPDITPAQVSAIAVFVIAQLVAYGVLTTHGAQLAVSITGTVIAATWKIADAIIRHGRATGAGGSGGQ